MNRLHRKPNGIARALFKRFRISVQRNPVLIMTKASCESNTNLSPGSLTPGSLSPASAKIPEPLAHVLTVDVEDYFQVEAFAEKVKRDDWEQYPSRVDANTRRVLDLFDEHGARGTFFFVGWVADKFPELVREVHARGHELACHSYWPRTIYSLSPEEFREDTRRAKQAIENAA